MHTGIKWSLYFVLLSIFIISMSDAMNMPSLPPSIPDSISNPIVNMQPSIETTQPPIMQPPMQMSEQPVMQMQPQQPSTPNIIPEMPTQEATQPIDIQQPVSSPMQIPVPPIEQKEEIPATEPEVGPVITGIDTIQLAEPRGNWHFKKIWWERAEQQYDKIRSAIEKINELRIKFFANRTFLDKTVFDPFFIDIGFGQGELATILSTLIERLEQERQKEGTLNEQERELLDTIIKDRDLIEQLHRDAQSIALLEGAADDLIERVMEQKSRVSAYEKEAWGYLKEIARILSDTQARELYYKIDAAWRNIKNIHRYLEQDLQRYFDQLINNARQQVERIKNAMQTLKEKGIDLKYSVERISQQEKVMPEEEQKAEPTPKTVIKKGILKRSWDFISYSISAIGNVVLWVPRKIAILFKK